MNAVLVARGLVVSYLTADLRVQGSNKCQAEATLLVRSDIILPPPFMLQSEKSSKSDVEFHISYDLHCYVQINSVTKPNFK